MFCFHQSLHSYCYHLALQRLILSSCPGSQDEANKHRLNFNLRVISGAGGPPGPQHASMDVKESYREKFVPPEISMVNYLMAKVSFLCILFVYTTFGII